MREDLPSGSLCPGNGAKQTADVLMSAFEPGRCLGQQRDYIDYALEPEHVVPGCLIPGLEVDDARAKSHCSQRGSPDERTTLSE